MATRTMITDLWATSAVAKLFAHSGISFLIVSPDRKLADVNQTFCDMLGYTREELLNMPIEDLTHRDDLTMTTKLFASAAGRNLVQIFEKRYVAKNGDTVWIRGRSEPLTDDGGGIYRIVMLENITARKQNELFLKQMAAIVNGSEDAIFRSNTQGNIEFWSKGAERLYGYTAAEAVGRSAGFIAANPYTAEEVAGIRKLMQGQVFKQSQANSRHKDGRILDVSILIFPLKNSKEEIVAFAAVHRDISELRHLGEQLRLSQRMETAGMLAGGIAHDFNNILTVIKGSCDVLATEMPGLLQGRH
ncbi:MAG: PAS domain S-box protein, partial [Pseudomonadota bacterium]